MTRYGKRLGLAVLLPLCLAGCGRIISTKATDQLIAGDAVDRSVAQIDFRLFTGKKVFLDTQFVNKTVPGVGFVTSDYIVSSIRQKMMCDGCLLQEKIEQADFIVEMRIGALGADGHEIVFGMPPNNYASIAASVSPTSSPAAAILPSMPELSVAKKDDQMAAAKVALFAYNRHTREPIWQSGISESRSVVADRWFFGAGPFQKGNVYDPKRPQTNSSSSSSLFSSDDAESMKPDYFVERRFADPAKSLADTPPEAKTAVAATPAAGTPAVAAATPAKAATATPATTPTTAPATTPTTAVATTAPAPATTVAAAPVVNPPAPGTAVPVPSPAPSATTTAAAAATPPVAATQTVNAAPAPVATPGTNAAPAANPAAAPATVGSPTAANSTPSASPAPNTPKPGPAVNPLPNGQPVNGTAPSTGSTSGATPDMLSVSLH